MVKFILHRPRNPKNIGASARGMANFGFRDLSVVAPYAKLWRETRAAVKAAGVVEKAKKFATLTQALKGCHVVVGTSTGSRRNPAARWITLEELRALALDPAKPKRRTAILFGSEKSGLSNEDLAFCHYLLRIPTVEECPSMNLSQAVAVVAYALRPDKAPARGLTSLEEPVPVEDVERLIKQALLAYTKAGLLKGWDEVRAERRIRSSFYRWNLNRVDVAMLHGIFRWTIKKA